VQQVQISGSDSQSKRAHVERLLARYPRLTGAQIEDLTSWFNREASAYDRATIASNEAVRSQYREFSKAHLDPFTPQDLIRAGLFIAVVIAGIVGIVWRAI
jgi:hypothetical protein